MRKKKVLRGKSPELLPHGDDPMTWYCDACGAIYENMTRNQASAVWAAHTIEVHQKRAVPEMIGQAAAAIVKEVAGGK